MDMFYKYVGLTKAKSNKGKNAPKNKQVVPKPALQVTSAEIIIFLMNAIFYVGINRCYNKRKKYSSKLY